MRSAAEVRHGGRARLRARLSVQCAISRTQLNTQADGSLHRRSALQLPATESRRRSEPVRHRICWLNDRVLDKARVEELADGLDLDRVFACQACLFEVGWAIHA